MSTARDELPRVPGSELDFDSDLVFSVDGQPFTGIGYEDVPGRGLSEVTYRDGPQDGPARDWYPSGKLKAESHHWKNMLHGGFRELSEDGAVLFEAVYEFSVLVSSVRRDGAGRVVETFQIDPSSTNFAALERWRRTTS